MISQLRSYLSGKGLGPTLIKAVTGSAGLRIAGMGFGFLVGVQLARGLGAEGYGIYGIAMSILALLTVPTEFGLPMLLTREVAAAQVKQDWARMKGILHWSSRMSFMISIIIGAGVIAWLCFSGQGLSTALGLTLLAGMLMVPVVAQLSLRSAALRGLQQIVRGQIPVVLMRPMFHSLLLFLTGLWLVPMSPAMAMLLGVGAAGAALLIAVYMLRRRLPQESVCAAPVVDASRWLVDALPMALTEGMRLLQAHLLILLLGVTVLMTEVGIYRVASSLVLLIAMPISLFNIVSMPVIARLHAAGETRRLKRMLGFVSGGMTAGVIMLSLPFAVAGEDIISLLFGHEYESANSVLLVLCGGMLVNALLGAAAPVLNMTGHQSRVTRASLFALVLMAICAVPLIHVFGILGAAFSHLVSFALWHLLMWRDCIARLSYNTSIFALQRDGGQSA
ncbi:oligosaccharide flippase family protein [Luteimonas qiangzhengi]|uniref:oligosaccharide flippase family protein n=1 Tax=Luteimonas sp. MJ146 TaxID=3129240 RepID=UPI0031BA8B71